MSKTSPTPNKANLHNFRKQSKKEVFQLDTSEPTIFDNDEDEEDEFSPYEVFREN